MLRPILLLFQLLFFEISHEARFYVVKPVSPMALMQVLYIRAEQLGPFLVGYFRLVPRANTLHGWLAVALVFNVAVVVYYRDNLVGWLSC